MTETPDALAVDGTDLASITGLRIIGSMNLWAPMTRRGSDDVIPGRRGQLPTPGLQLDAYSFTIDVQIQGATRAARNAVLAGLGNLFSGASFDGLVTLTRTIAHDPDPISYDAPGRFVSGLAMDILNPYTGRTQLQFVNLVGAWRNTVTGIWHAP